MDALGEIDECPSVFPKNKPDKDDIVCLCKTHMWHDHLSQPPFLVLPAASAGKLEQGTPKGTI